LHARGRAAAAIGVALALVVVLGACPNATLVTVYEPQRGMRTPTLIERKVNPLATTRVALRCLEVPTTDPIARMFAANEARDVCGRLAKALQNAGATATVVTTLVPAARGEEDPYDLYVEWQVKQEHNASSPWMEAASTMTCTLLPTIEQRTFVHRAVIRGRDGGVLQTHESRARFLDYDGCGVWLVTWALDFLRDDDHKVGDPHSRQRYSHDLYTQLTQALVNARARSDVLHLTPPRINAGLHAPATTPPPSSTTTPTTTTTPAPTPAPTPAAPTTTTTPTTPPTTPPTTTPTPAVPAPTPAVPAPTPPQPPPPAPSTDAAPVDPSDDPGAR
jgi:pyruvate/2-oxoglutarate dehydrogenase complex dihydrolipoamide acyltransferase (E2) component